MGVRLLAAVAAMLLVGACSENATRSVTSKPTAASTPVDLNCTLVGGMNGVGVHIPKELWVTSGTITFRVCDKDGCVEARRRLRPFPKDWYGGYPAERTAHANIKNFGHRFETGKARMTAEIRDAHGALVGSGTRTIKLHRYWPNGKRCDGEGFLSGGFNMKASDKV